MQFNAAILQKMKRKKLFIIISGKFYTIKMLLKVNCADFRELRVVNWRFSKIFFFLVTLAPPHNRTPCGKKQKIEDVCLLPFHNFGFNIFFRMYVIWEVIDEKSKFAPFLFPKENTICMDFWEVRKYWNSYSTLPVHEIFPFTEFLSNSSDFWAEKPIPPLSTSKKKKKTKIERP